MKNYFKIFEIEEKFSIDNEILEKRYLELQSEFHPDKSNLENTNLITEINEAYKVLLKICEEIEKAESSGLNIDKWYYLRHKLLQ